MIDSSAPLWDSGAVAGRETACDLKGRAKAVMTGAVILGVDGLRSFLVSLRLCKSLSQRLPGLRVTEQTRNSEQLFVTTVKRL